MESPCVTIGIAGPDASSNRLLLSQLTGFDFNDVPQTVNLLPGGMLNAEQADACAQQLCTFYFAEARVLYLSLVVKNALLSGGDEERAAFSLRHLLWLLLSCHMVLWTQQAMQVDPRVLSWLRGMQVAKQAAAAELAPVLPLCQSSRGPKQKDPDKKKLRQQPGKAGQDDAFVPVPQLALLFPSDLSAAEAKAVRGEEAALDVQVRNELSKAGLIPQGPARGSHLFAVPEAHAVHVVPSVDANLQAAFDAAYAGLRGSKSSSELTGTAATFADVRQLVTQAVGVLHGTADAKAAKAQQQQQQQQALPSLRQWWERFRQLGVRLEEAAGALDAALAETTTVGSASLPQNLTIRKRTGRKGKLSGGNLDALTAALDALAATSDPIHHSSQAKCSQAMIRAFTFYQSSVPSAYPPAVHASALAAALEQYHTAAAGPATHKHARRLQQACIGHWEHRQQCGALSLTGHPCIQPPGSKCKPPPASQHESRNANEPQSPVAEDSVPSGVSVKADSSMDESAQGKASNVESSQASRGAEAASSAGTQQAAEMGSSLTEAQQAGSGAHAHSSGILYWLADATSLQRRKVEDPYDLHTANSHGVSDPSAYRLTSLAITVTHTSLRQRHKSAASAGAGIPLGEWVHVCYVPAREHAAALHEPAKGWTGGGRGPCTLQVPPLGAEAESKPEGTAAGTQQSGALSNAEFPPLPASPGPRPRQQQARQGHVDAQPHAAYQTFIRERWWPGLTAGPPLALTHALARKNQHDGSGQSTGGRKKGKRGPVKQDRDSAAAVMSPKPGPNSLVIAIGVEYESLQGERFFHYPSNPSQPSQLAGQALLTQDLPLYLHSPPKAGPAAISGAPGGSDGKQGSFQLRRLQFSCPANLRARFSSRPVMRLQVAGSQLTYTPSEAASLQPGTNTVVTLPWVFALPAGQLTSDAVFKVSQAPLQPDWSVMQQHQQQGCPAKLKLDAITVHGKEPVPLGAARLLKGSLLFPV